jgi:hypothetical protein
MDTTESLAVVGDCMGALKAVQLCFPTNTVQKTVKMAEHLVHMCQRNKLEAAETLNRSTQGILESRGYSVSAPGEEDARAADSHNAASSSLVAVQEDKISLSTAPGKTDLVGLDLFDWEEFLRSDFAFDLGFSDPYNISPTEETV